MKVLSLYFYSKVNYYDDGINKMYCNLKYSPSHRVM